MIINLGQEETRNIIEIVVSIPIVASGHFLSSMLANIFKPKNLITFAGTNTGNVVPHVSCMVPIILWNFPQDFSRDTHFIFRDCMHSSNCANACRRDDSKLKEA